MALASHTSFTTTGVRGLRHDILPMRLYHKAKKLGVWDPRTIDFSQDIIDWQNCTEVEKLSLLALTALFQAGEESVTLDLLPLMMVIAQEGRLEEEMFLTTFLWEEAKHTEFFRRFLDRDERVGRRHERDRDPPVTVPRNSIGPPGPRRPRRSAAVGAAAVAWGLATTYTARAIVRRLSR